MDQAIAALVRDPEADSVRTVCPPQQNPYKIWRPEGPYLRPILAADTAPEPFNAPRQTLPQVFWQTGQVDAVRPKRYSSPGP